MSLKPLDYQIAGDHYQKMKIQPVEFIFANDIPFLEANVIKYICRWKDKGGQDDLHKVIHYTKMILDFNSSEDKDE